MEVTVINPLSGWQNANGLGGAKTTRANNSPPASVSVENVGAGFSGAMDALQGQSVRAIARISSFEVQLDNVNVVVFPPFFPIAKYQRIELIMQVNGIQEEIGQSSLPASVKEIIGDKLDDEATDAQISDAISKLFAVRDTLTKNKAVANQANEPGSLLTLKI